jgi:hypothetical protein
LINYASIRASLFIPQNDSTDDLKFYTAMGMNIYNNGVGGYDKNGIFKATYVELTEDQIRTILPYTTNAGISEVPLLSLIIGEISSTDSMYRGNTLILPEYMDEVLELVKDNPRITITDPFEFTQIKQ